MEQARKVNFSRGAFDRRPASEWRQIDFAHEPSDRRAFGTTSLQQHLEAKGWDNQGNGSTMAALAARGLIVRGDRPGMLGGIMHTVTLTRQGRAAARTGTSLTPGVKPKAALGHRGWEVLVMLWKRGQRGEVLDWDHSPTIKDVLIGKHIPPLAEKVPGGYALTDRGRDFYRQQYTVHCAAHPDVWAPHPDGAQAEPWPGRTDELLDLHAQRYAALVQAWRTAAVRRRTNGASADVTGGKGRSPCVHRTRVSPWWHSPRFCTDTCARACCCAASTRRSWRCPGS